MAWLARLLIGVVVVTGVVMATPGDDLTTPTTTHTPTNTTTTSPPLDKQPRIADFAYDSISKTYDIRTDSNDNLDNQTYDSHGDYDSQVYDKHPISDKYDTQSYETYNSQQIHDNYDLHYDDYYYDRQANDNAYPTYDYHYYDYGTQNSIYDSQTPETKTNTTDSGYLHKMMKKSFYDMLYDRPDFVVFNKVSNFLNRGFGFDESGGRSIGTNNRQDILGFDSLSAVGIIGAALLIQLLLTGIYVSSCSGRTETCTTTCPNAPDPVCATDCAPPTFINPTCTTTCTLANPACATACPNNRRKRDADPMGDSYNWLLGPGGWFEGWEHLGIVHSAINTFTGSGLASFLPGSQETGRLLCNAAGRMLS